MSKKAYIILLKNNYLLFSTKKVKRKGNYTQDVKIFETDDSCNSLEITNWVENNHQHPKIKEIENW